MSTRDRDAAERIAAACPQWTGLAPAAEAISLPKGVLLHAGPPFPAPEAISRPILNAAVYAALFEGWAKTAEAARAKILSGELRLEPAQNWNACAPLAAAISPSMWLQVVTDARNPERKAYAPLNTGLTLPMPLAGTDDPSVVERHKVVNGEIAPLMTEMLSDPIDMLALVSESLRQGDECHGRSGVGSAMIRAAAAERLPSGARRDTVLGFLDGAPMFFLFLAMAVAKNMMQAGEGVASASIVTTAGGNGRDFGIKLSGEPDRWFTARGGPPEGFLFSEQNAGLPRLGAVGDSAVIDCVGFGGMALRYAPELVRLFGANVPEHAFDLPGKLLAATHPRLLDGDVCVALSARSVSECGLPPIAFLGILDADGHGGIIGRGVFTTPLAAFTGAVASLDGEASAREGEA